MTAYAPAYRLRVYAPRSVDPTEATVLVPVAGAPHADAFQVATIQGVAGYQPYLDIPTGRNGRIDALERQLSTGEWTFPLLDRSIAGSQLKRWFTAFLGNLKGQPRLAGLRFECDESLTINVDGTRTDWARWRTGRVVNIKIGAVQGSLAVREITDEAKMLAFVGNPHSSIAYAARQAVCPIGMLGSDWGTIKAAIPLTGTARSVTVNAIAQGATTYCRIDLAATGTGAAARKDNIVTKQLIGAAAPDDTIAIVGSLSSDNVARIPNFSGPLRARVKHTSGANNGLTGDYKAAGLSLVPGLNGKYRLGSICLLALDAGDVNQLATPAAGVTVELVAWVDAPISKNNPLFLNDVHFATLLQDLCDGKFGYVYRVGEFKPVTKAYGDPKRTVPLLNSATFVADTTYPLQRFIITDSEEMVRWVEKNLLKPLNVSLYPDEQGRLVIVDMRLPTSLAGLPTFTEADLARDHEQGDWEFDRDSVITRCDFTYYSDRPIVAEDLENADVTFPDLPSGGVESFEHPHPVLDVGSADVGDRSYEVDCPGFRTMPGETMQAQDRALYLKGKLVELANQFRRPFGWGIVELPVTLRRGGGVVAPGGIAIATFQHVPDPSSWQRGGARVMRALEVSPLGATRSVRFLDLGVNLFANVPALAQPAQEAGNTYTGVTSVLTLNAAGQAAEVRFAITDTSVGAAPADTSPLWTVIDRYTTSQTVIFRGAAPNKRVWVQGRTLPDYIDSFLPSAWVLAAGTGRVDTAALPAPSAPVSSLVAGKTFRVSWTNGAADLGTEILLATPTSDPRVVVARLLPGSTFFDFPGATGVGIQISTQYRVGIRHFGVTANGVSAEVTIDVTTTGTPAVAPDFAAVTCLIGLP